MGCCVSTNKTSASTSTFQKKQQHFQVGSEEPLKSKSTHESRAPPPPSLDQEETVKEVLSETPKPKPPPSPPKSIIKNLQTKQQHQENNNHNDKKIHIQPPFLDEKITKENRPKNEKITFQEEEVVSEQDVSEVCSLSLSESVSTTTVTNDRRDDDEEEVMKQRVMRSPSPKLPRRNRAFAGDLGPRRDRVVGKSPTWRSEQSPKKRNNAGGGGSVRLVQSRESGTCHQMARRGGLRSDPNRRDPGESSGRRSRSPATNRSAMSRSPSSTRTVRSPGRVVKDPPENGGTNNKKVESGKEPNKWPSSSTSGTTSESLENPLVSLECFIFL